MQDTHKDEKTHLWYERLRAFEVVLVVLYALALPLPITIPWALLIAGMVVGVLLCLLSPSKSSLSGTNLPPFLIPLLIFAVLVTVSGLVNGGVQEAFKSLSSLRAILVYPWAYLAFKRSPHSVPLAVTAVLSMGALAGIWGAVQQVFDIHPFGFRYLQATGFLSGPMAYAGQMQIFALLATALYVRNGYRALSWPFGSKSFSAALMAANWLGVLFASERSAWLGVVAGLLSISFFISWRLAVKLLLSLFVAGTIAWTAVPVVKTRLMPIFTGAVDASVTVRLEVWKQSLALFQSSPVFGVGIRRFPHLHIKEASIPGYKDFLDHAHSNYMHILATTGVAGMLSYLILLAAVLRKCAIEAAARRSTGDAFEFKREAFDRAVSLGMFAATVSLAVAGVFEYNFGTGQVRLTQWFLLSLIGLASNSRLESLKSIDAQPYAVRSAEKE